MDQVFVEGLEFLGRHGVTARERRVGHRCRADVVVDVDTHAAAASDSVRSTVDYRRLAEIVITLGAERSFKLLETLAEEVASAVMAEWPATRVEVTVRKLGAPVPGSPVACGVRVVRERVRPGS
jgi:dihydroneopterin aldolase